ncbi:Uncharacterised protein [Mycobacterium tuberculosis]|nr:Uncharacterised protein [Mycobacterium tuberculosis]
MTDRTSLQVGSDALCLLQGAANGEHTISSVRSQLESRL